MFSNACSQIKHMSSWTQNPQLLLELRIQVSYAALSWDTTRRYGDDEYLWISTWMSASCSLSHYSLAQIHCLLIPIPISNTMGKKRLQNANCNTFSCLVLLEWLLPPSTVASENKQAENLFIWSNYKSQERSLSSARNFTVLIGLRKTEFGEQELIVILPMLANDGLLSVTSSLLFILSKSAAFKQKLVIAYVFVAKLRAAFAGPRLLTKGWGVACAAAAAFPVPALGGNWSWQRGWEICSLDAASAFQTHTSVLSIIGKRNTTACLRGITEPRCTSHPAHRLQLPQLSSPLRHP